MKTIDVRLTLTPEALGRVLARLDTAPPGAAGDTCREAACAMKMCAQYQRVVREAYEAGVPLAPRLTAVKMSEAFLPLKGDPS